MFRIILSCALFLVYLNGEASAYCGSMCCPGRNNTCYTTGLRMNSKVGAKSHISRCFCDESCSDMNDCCFDYESSCAPVDCAVSQWSAWSACSKPCGVGMVKRSRSVQVQPRNGGDPCPSLHGSNICFGKCRATLHRDRSGNRVLKETGRIIPGTFGKYRTSLQYDYRKDIRKNLFYQYHAQHQPVRTQTCREFRIISSKRACSRSPWASVLRPGQRICVQCQETAMKRELDWRCRGQGQVNQRTYWSANGASGCHGWWEMQDSTSGSCQCKGDKRTDFLFV